MADELKLTLPEREPKKHGPPKMVLLLLVLTVLLGAANLAVLLGRRSPSPAGDLPASKLKEVALKLEQQDLREGALAAWRQYLQSPGLGGDERAKIWYRVGTLEQEAGRDEAALDAYYPSEAQASLKEIAPEIARRVRECLEPSGKFAALQHELRERTSPEPGPAKPGSAIVAEIGPRKVTLEELDRRIEKMIDLQLEQFGSALPADERAKQREALLKRFSTPEARDQQLRRFLMEEVLTRKAREDKLQQDPAVKDLLAMAERTILSHKEMGKELSDKVHITESDLKNYYEAHKADFKEKRQGEAEKQKSFEEARPEVYGALRRQKEQEVQEELFTALEKRYDVVIHNAALGKAGKN
jgi:hypothetical protein